LAFKCIDAFEEFFVNKCNEKTHGFTSCSIRKFALHVKKPTLFCTGCETKDYEKRWNTNKETEAKKYDFAANGTD